MRYQHTDEERTAILGRVYTAAVYDVMDEMDLPEQCLDLLIKPLYRGMRIAGPAVTIAGMADPRPKSEWPSEGTIDKRTMFDAVYPGAVVVYSTTGEDRSGQWGELMSIAARAKGGIGIITDGGVRDSELLRQIDGWSVFSRYLSPIESRRRFRPVALETTISMPGSLSAQVAVHPGDWIVGDADGVLVVPADALDEVLERTANILREEQSIREEVRDTGELQEAYERYGRL